MANKVTVRDLIIKLLDEPLDLEVIIKKDGKRLHNVEICTRLEHSKGLPALFG